jgi:hypothetical protein
MGARCCDDILCAYIVPVPVPKPRKNTHAPPTTPAWYLLIFMGLYELGFYQFD